MKGIISAISVFKFLFVCLSLPPSCCRFKNRRQSTSLVRGRQERLPLTRELSPKVTEGETPLNKNLPSERSKGLTSLRYSAFLRNLLTFSKFAYIINVSSRLTPDTDVSEVGTALRQPTFFMRPLDFSFFIAYNSINKNRDTCLSPPYEMWRFFMYGKLLKKTLSLLMPFFCTRKSFG